MACQTAIAQLPGGARYLRLELLGEVTEADLTGLIKDSDPGGANEGLPILVLTQQLSSISSEARGLLARRGEERRNQTAWVAVVVTNPVVRVTINFVSRILRSDRVKLFSTEAEGLQWLDQLIR